MVLEISRTQPDSIANHLQISPSTVTRLIEKLKEKQLVIRTAEGRQTSLFLTIVAKQLLPI